MVDCHAVEEKLRQRLAALGRRVARLGEAQREPLDPRFAEQAVELETADADAALETAARAEMRMIEAALGRIADGTYGDCETCGVPIAPARLAALPYATRCLACAGG